MGYDSRIWSVLFYALSGLFAAVAASSAPELGLTAVAYKWTLIGLSVGLGVTGKLGKSWLGKGEDSSASGTGRIMPAVLLVLILPVSLLLGGCRATASGGTGHAGDKPAPPGVVQK